MTSARIAGLLLLGCLASGPVQAQETPAVGAPASVAPKKITPKPKKARAAKRPATDSAGRSAIGTVPPADYSTSADFSKMQSPITDPENGGAAPWSSKGGAHPTMGAGGGAGMDLGF